MSSPGPRNAGADGTVAVARSFAGAEAIAATPACGQCSDAIFSAAREAFPNFAPSAPRRNEPAVAMRARRP